MIKKILAVLLVTFLLAQPVMAFQFNDGTLNWGDCPHTYDNACDNKCNACGVQRTVPPHPYAAVTTPATCGGAGHIIYTCTECGDSYTESIPATGQHTYKGEVTVPATCVSAGVMTYTCTACGDRYTESVVDANNHRYDTPCDGDCNDCGATRTPPHQYADPYDADCDLCGAGRPVNTLQVGDVNGDGKVNVRDQGLLQQHLNGWEVSLSLAAADVNGDGKVNVRDQGLLQQYLNGWDVTLG